MQQCDQFRVLASSTRVCHLSCTTIFTCSTFQSVSTTSWTLLCIAACRRKLRDTYSRLLHASSEVAVNNYAQPVDNNLYCVALPAEHVWAPGLFGHRSYSSRSSLPNRIHGPTISSDSFRKLLKTELYLRVIKLTKRSKMLHDSSLYKSTIDTETDTDNIKHGAKQCTVYRTLEEIGSSETIRAGHFLHGRLGLTVATHLNDVILQQVNRFLVMSHLLAQRYTR